MGKRPAVPLKRAARVLLDLFFEQTVCPVCGAEGKSLCPVCLKETELWGSYALGETQGLALYHYSRTVRSLIDRSRSGSFAAQDSLFLLLDRWVAAQGNVFLNEGAFDLLVPIPQSRNRGSSGAAPADSLARRLSAKAGIPIASCLGQQTRRKGRAGHPEPEGAELFFHESFRLKVRGKSVLLVDDLMASEDRILTAAALLHQQGIGRVSFFVLARATG